jgi:hypothetical protein
MNIRCPKSETRVPVGYCRESCLNPCEEYYKVMADRERGYDAEGEREKTGA